MADTSDVRPYGRSTKYVVTPVDAVRLLNIRTNDEVVQAQTAVDDEMLAALEEMINSARAGRITEADTALALAAAKW